ncbi:hypothetical protein JHK87_001227 [Glycine soja]|nr:hypothetical protein JHK87_001227 [Glycine soja]KAG5088606.1 hypothetical protein JHK86_001218 [Glycine max]
MRLSRANEPASNLPVISAWLVQTNRQLSQIIEEELVNDHLYPINLRNQGYTYWDYIDVWTNVFWHQNNKFKHSRLIYFKNNTVYNFSNWFLQWWNFFGPTSQIYPEQVRQGFEQFNRMFNNQESRIPADLMYLSSFALSWIFSWQYRYGKTESSKQFPPLQGHAFVKWWTQFDTSKAAPDQVKNWFQAHPEFVKPTDSKTSLFLNQKSRLAAFLDSSKSKESTAKNLKEVSNFFNKRKKKVLRPKRKKVNLQKRMMIHFTKTKMIVLVYH